MCKAPVAFEATKSLNVAWLLKRFCRLASPMGRPRAGTDGRRKTKISVTLDANVLEWAVERTGPGQRFSSVSHAVEVALAELAKREK